MMINTEKIDIIPVCPMCRSNNVETFEEAALVPAKNDLPEFSYMQPKIACRKEQCLSVSLAPEHKQILHEAVCKASNLLTPGEIKNIRLKFGRKTNKGKIGQRDFAKALGLGEVTISRYETGKQIQTRSIDYLIRASELSGFDTIIEHARIPKSNVIDMPERFPQIKSNPKGQASFSLVGAK